MKTAPGQSKEPEAINEILASATCVHHGFYGGSLGLLLYYYHSGHAAGNEKHLQKADDLLEEVFEKLNNGETTIGGISLCNGGAGFGAVINYLANKGWIDLDVDTELEPIDEYIFQDSLAALQNINTDLLHGPVGAILYFPHRRQTSKIQNYLSILVNNLLGLTVQGNPGIWFRNETWTKMDKKDYVDLGLAHNLSGILLTLIEAFPHIAQKELCRNVIMDGLKLILADELPVSFE